MAQYANAISLTPKFTYSAIVGAVDHDRPVLEWLALKYTHSDIATWNDRLAAGQVTTDGVPLTVKTKLRRGQRIEWARPPWIEADVPRDFRVVYRDDDLLVVDKPAGLPTMPAGGFLENTLLSLVRAEHPTANPVHRLGRGTSGLVVFALSREAASQLTRDLREHRIDKHYVALIEGNPAWDVLEIRAPIGQLPHPKLGEIFAANQNGRPAYSVATVTARAVTFPPDSDRVRNEGQAAMLSRVSVQIYTGRPHQIRIHLAWAGHPLWGDPLYGPGGVPKTQALPGELGYCLHAARLALVHPRTKASLNLHANAPF